MIDAGKEILVVITSTRELPEHPGRRDAIDGLAEEEARRTGFDVMEVAYVYEFFKKERLSMTFASPRGGECHIDPLSLKASERDDIVKSFMKDHQAMEMIKSTKRLDEVRPDRYYCAIFPGGLGTLYDFPNNPKINDIVQQVWEKNQGYIAAIGHGIAALLNVKIRGEPCLKGKKVTCSTLEEEREMKIDKFLPFSLEHRLKEIGVRFEKGNRFEPHVVADERLVTGQNRNSSRDWVHRLMEECKKKGL